MVIYLLDSDIIIEFLKDSKKTVGLLYGIEAEGLSCSVLTIIEVKRGLTSKQEARSRDLFKIIRTFQVTKEIAELAAKLAREWQARGKYLQLVDATIAATCIIHDLTLVTYNKRDYPMRELKKL